MVTIIIPHRPDESIAGTVARLSKMKYPKACIEIYGVSGNQPSAQRNACIRKAKGDIIYFIDNDSEVTPGNIMHAVELFARDPKIAVIGGPNVAKSSDSALQKAFSAALTSPFGAGPVANRYRTSGGIRETTDRELILCNLFVRRSVLMKEGLFKEDFYPNEENELMDRLRVAGYKLYYHPDIIVHRSPRATMASFIKMLLNYGRGRFQQLAHAPRIQNATFLIPAFFVLYLASFAAVPFIPVAMSFKLLYCIPLMLWALLAVVASILTRATLLRTRHILTMMPMLFFVIHFFYGVGIFYGVIRYAFRKKISIRFTIKKIKPLAQ
ncbi:MAG: glycosyltransferase [Spirochaetes bacterium]|nr:glycosyltransferase [Spirochaetota bacterium]